MARKVEFFALSTCGWCHKTKNWLDEHRVHYDITYVDQTTGPERERTSSRMRQFSERPAFPLIVIDEGAKVIQGFHPEELEDCLK